MRHLPVVATILAAVLATTAAAPAVSAGARTPDLVIGVGRTLKAEGEPGGGGMSLGVSALWRIEDRFRAGVMVFADGLGERTGRLVGPGGVDLGPVAGVHRAAQGAAIRLEAHPASGRWLRPYVTATWGFYRVDDDVRGTLLARDDAAGFGLGLGLLRELNRNHAAGIALRGQQLSRGGAGRYLSAALEWRWSLSAGD